MLNAQERDSPMAPLDTLAALAGRWTGTSRLQDPENNIANESTSSLVVTPLLDGRFVRLDYDWSYHGKPQQGSMLVGHDPKSGEVTAHWIDSWHNGTKVMVCTGTARDDGGLSVLATYAAPPGPDWGWRTMIAPADDALDIVMHNVSPDGTEELAFELELSRV